MRDAYRKLYGRQHEAWFNSGPVNLLQARALHREWWSLIESRIANIRAERAGQHDHAARSESTLGEWYKWLLKLMAAKKVVFGDMARITRTNRG